ncbi:aldehyde dehydrogenase family protein [Mycolicibacterium hodleri]|uniref:aldehyde dehydrogenase family protein n=1 Tax=Mycolicibacterium hodleri TaxID=49897 RepID=UPI003183F716
MTELLDRQRAAFLSDGIPGPATRIDRVSRLQSMILDNTEAIVTALAEDFGTRAREVSVLADVVGCMGDLEYQKKHLRSWMRTRSHGWLLNRSGLRQRIRHDPLGVVGVMGPWNFPVQLTMLPSGTALAAGNRVMVRPSEVTAVTTQLLADLAPQYFPAGEMTILTDEQADGPTFASLGFDHLFFTGSPAVGALVAQVAGKNLVPATLELGGKNPAVVDRSADLSRAAQRIAASRMINGGQVCMCPDYVLVPEESQDAFVGEVMAQWRKAFPHILSNGDYTSVINDRHYDHVVGLIDDAVELGARRSHHVPSGEELPDRATRKIPPTLLLGVPGDAKVNREEIFGPVLVVHPYRELSDALDYVNARPHPLTVYWYGADNERYDQLQRATRSGSVNANDFTLNFIGSDLPFGGVGRSGTGAYRGRAGFATFTHARGVAFSRWPVSLARLMAPPFSRSDARLVNLQLAAFRRRNRRRKSSP